MYSADYRVIGRVVLAAFIPVLLLGCGRPHTPGVCVPDLPNVGWTISYCDPKGQCWLWQTSSKSLYDASGDGGHFRKIKTIWYCRFGWVDPISGAYATHETEQGAGDRTGVIRVYDRDGTLIAEYRPTHPLSKEYCLSGPALCEGGRRVAFISCGDLFVGDLTQRPVEFHRVCQVGDPVQVTVDNPYWLGDQAVAIELRHSSDIVIISLANSRWRVIPNEYGYLLGASPDHLVTYSPGSGVRLLSIKGEVEAKVGWLYDPIRYSAYFIHRSSPDGQFVIYNGSIHGREAQVILHVPSGRKVALKGPAQSLRWLGNWTVSRGSSQAFEPK